MNNVNTIGSGQFLRGKPLRLGCATRVGGRRGLRANQPFPLATTGCLKTHCTTAENGAIGIAPPTPMTSGICSTTPCIGTVHYFATGGAGLALTCTSSGSMVACLSDDSSPHLTVYNGSGTSILFTSCSNPSATSCTGLTPATDPCGNSVTDFFGDSVGPALIGSDGTVIVAGGTEIYRFNSNGSQDWGTCLPSAAHGFAPTGTILTSDASGNENVTLLMRDGPVVTLKAESGAIVTTNQGGSNLGYFEPDQGSDSNGSYFYTGTNSACAVGNRIYAVMNRYDPASQSSSQPSGAY